MSARIAIRTDAARPIGSGHVMRCLTLARRLRESGHAVRFVCADFPGKLDTVIAREFPVDLLPRSDAPTDANRHEDWLGLPCEEDADQTIAALRDFRPDWFITDHYAIDARWHRAIRQAFGCRIMVIDDLANRPHDADILLDQNYHDDAAARYQALVPSHCQCFVGPRYALIKPEFFTTPVRPRHHDRPERLFMFFGGVDIPRMTLRSLQALAALPQRPMHGDVVCGGHNAELAAIAALCKQLGYRLHVDTEHMAALMADADLAIGGGGVTTWERGFLHLPSLVVTLAANQYGITEAAARAGFICYIGKEHELTEDMLQRAITEFLDDSVGRNALEQRCAGYFTQSGLREVIEAMA